MFMNMEENLPPGFRFHPTDEELISYYLTQKLSDSSFTSKAISVVDLNKNEPWDLPAKASMGKKEWYFFNMRDRKYPTGVRTNRATEAGYWKTTGKDKEVFGGGVLVGMKKTLVFYKGRAPTGEKSNWVMHEYRQQNHHFFKPSQEEWVVCRVFEKQNNPPKKPQQISSSSQPNNQLVNEFEDIIQLPNSPNLISNNFINNNNNNNISADQTYENNNMMINWATPTTNDQLITTPSITTTLPNSLNYSLLLKALQLRTIQQSELVFGAFNSHFGSTHDHLSFQASSSSNVFESSPQQQQQQQQQPEQPLNLDSLW